MKLSAVLSKSILVLPLLFGACLDEESSNEDFQGYWRGTDTAGDYVKFLRIEGDKGFYCVGDGKSSFHFTIEDGYITTPFNGKDKIERTTDSTHIAISGEEKGEPYRSEFVKMLPSGYPAECRQEENEFQ